MGINVESNKQNAYSRKMIDKQASHIMTVVWVWPVQCPMNVFIEPCQKCVQLNPSSSPIRFLTRWNILLIVHDNWVERLNYHHCVRINFLSKVILEKMCWFPRVIYVLDLFEQIFPVHVALIWKRNNLLKYKARTIVLIQ